MPDDTYQALFKAVDRFGDAGGPHWTPALALADWCADNGHRFHELALRLWHRAGSWIYYHGWSWYGVLAGQTWALEAVPRLLRYRGHNVVDERAARRRQPARLPTDLSGDFNPGAAPGAGSWVWSGPAAGSDWVRTLCLTPSPAGPALEALFLPLLEAVAASRAKVPPRLWRGCLRVHDTGRVVRPPAHNPNHLHRRFCRPFLVHA